MKVNSFYSNGRDFALLYTPEGVVPPPRINDMDYWGEPQGIITKLSYRYEQSEIAESLNVTQQTVSRWVSKYSPMELSDEAWFTLVTRLHEVNGITKLERNPKARPTLRKEYREAIPNNHGSKLAESPDAKPSNPPTKENNQEGDES